MMNMLRLGSIVMVVSALAGCTERVNVCQSDSDCTNPAFPFCDVNGEYDESGHVANSCSIEPANCPVERCGCTPGAVTCIDDELATCNAGGRDVTKVTCTLGCAADGDRCQFFDPSNGLTEQLLGSADREEAVLPDGTTIDTTTGSVMVNGAPMNISSISVPQAGGPSIRVFGAKSWSIGNVRITGLQPVAFVSVGQIAVTGTLDASARHSSGGPGAVATGSACVGGARTTGGGGGGNLTPGGDGSVVIAGMQARGGVAAPAWGPFAGGCDGGDHVDTSGVPIAQGGAGGGAIQLASLTDIVISGTISLGGGGGDGPGAAGGSGGRLLLEAVDVRISGSVFANGGSGGACGQAGTDAMNSTEQASGPGPCGTPAYQRAGSGGTGASAPTMAGTGAVTGAGPGGGGGAAGRVRISTMSGSADKTGAVISAGIEESMLNPR